MRKMLRQLTDAGLEELRGLFVARLEAAIGELTRRALGSDSTDWMTNVLEQQAKLNVAQRFLADIDRELERREREVEDAREQMRGKGPE